MVSVHRIGSLISAFPVPGTKLIQAVSYAHSVHNSTARLEVQVSDGMIAYYFLKVAYENTAAANRDKLMARLF